MIKLDYFIGRTVSQIILGDKGWDWIIQLEGNVAIRNLDTNRSNPAGSVGTTVIQVEEEAGGIALCCGGSGVMADGVQWSRIRDEYVFTPGLYTISAPGFNNFDEMPGSAEEKISLAVAPHPDERAAEGPESITEVKDGEGQQGQA